MSLSNSQVKDTFQLMGFSMSLTQDVLSDGSKGYSVRIGVHTFPYSDEKEAVEAFTGIKKLLEKSL
jgi:hypothetical protein